MDPIDPNGYVRNRVKVRGGGTYVILSEFALNPKDSTRAIRDYLMVPGNLPPQTGKVVQIVLEKKRRR